MEVKPIAPLMGLHIEKGEINMTVKNNAQTNIEEKVPLSHSHHELAQEWHPTKNSKKPNEFVAGSGKKAWWLGKCGHEWEAVIRSRALNRTGCPYCSSPPVKLLKGFNDMWSTNPQLASILADPEDGYKHMEQSNKLIEWKCPSCDMTYKKKASVVRRYGLSCPCRKTGYSYPERLVYHTLRHMGIKFNPEKTFSWSQGKRYDFYLPDYNWIIEVHGIQHYQEKSGWGRRIVEEFKNDIAKEKLAFKNGISQYIIINSSKSDPLYILESIAKTKLHRVFKNIAKTELETIFKNAELGFSSEIWKLWNKGKTTKEISRDLSLGVATIRNILRRGNSIGIVNFNRKESYARMKKTSRKVVCINARDQEVEFFVSILSASSAKKISPSGISAVLSGAQKTSHGYHWMYKEDYDAMIAEHGKIVDL